MWQSEATWQHVDMCLCDTWTRVCALVRDVCEWHVRVIINGLGASVIGFKLTLKVVVCYKPDKTFNFIPCGIMCTWWRIIPKHEHTSCKWTWL